ncbi:hypothetical protein FKM82_010060 [Ascaphus truei]
MSPKTGEPKYPVAHASCSLKPEPSPKSPPAEGKGAYAPGSHLTQEPWDESPKDPPRAPRPGWGRGSLPHTHSDQEAAIETVKIAEQGKPQGVPLPGGVPFLPTPPPRACPAWPLPHQPTLRTQPPPSPYSAHCPPVETHPNRGRPPHRGLRQGPLTAEKKLLKGEKPSASVAASNTAGSPMHRGGSVGPPLRREGPPVVAEVPVSR